MSDGFEDRLRDALHARARQIDPPEDPLGDLRNRARRQQRRERTAGALVVAAVLAVGVAAALPLLTPEQEVVAPVDDGPGAAEARDVEPAPATCEASEHAVSYSVGYPGDWWTPEGTQHCRLFHPAPREVPEATDATGFAIIVHVEPAPFDEIAGAAFHEVRTSEEVAVDGRPALVQEIEAAEDLLVPEGTRTYRYLVDLGDGTLVAETSDAAAADYAATRGVLDEMADTLEIEVRGGGD